MAKNKILLIEDEAMLINMYKDKFARENLDISVANTVKEGIKKAQEIKPNLILLDILLPHENGLEFLKQAKKNPEISSIPVVAFSNYSDPSTQEEAIKLGAKEYIIKANYNPQETVEKIKEYLK